MSVRDELRSPALPARQKQLVAVPHFLGGGVLACDIWMSSGVVDSLQRQKLLHELFLIHRLFAYLFCVEHEVPPEVKTTTSRHSILLLHHCRYFSRYLLWP